jgi:DNA-binding response OmpR family regulator
MTAYSGVLSSSSILPGFVEKKVDGQIRILLVDDEPDMREMIGLVLRSANMEVLVAENGFQALEIWRNHEVDLIVLDVMMPVIDGMGTCRLIRRMSNVPILMLTARGREQDIVEGFEAGIDDYVTKPFRTRELVARIRAILQRTSHSADAAHKQLVYKDLVLDWVDRRATLNGREIPLTPVEYRLLQYFLQHVGEVISKEELLQNVWGYLEPAGDLNLIEAAIKRLRKKIGVGPLEPYHIQTVWGAGYRLGGK